MIPSIVSSQTRRGIEDFLLTTFPVTTPLFAKSLPNLLALKDSVFRGPYLSLKLPFLPGKGNHEFFPEIIPPGFRPFLHQERTFERLAGSPALSTLIATGTGSGKTEGFLFPILDYCRRHSGEGGVKAVVIYPMNALATDQARRVARVIHGSKALRDRVTAGLYIGGEGREKHSVMGPMDVITDHDALRRAPPDILLTNYKMLDYLLIRPADFSLWAGSGPESLKFLVVDELHTFDGAQGADLACLIRRLKARLKTRPGHLCCVGTSATMGETAENLNASNLREYAEQLFGEAFDREAIVGESLKSPEEFLKGHMVTRFAVPGPEARAQLDAMAYASQDDYLAVQHRLWLDEELGTGDSRKANLRLAGLLKEHAFFRNLLVILEGKAKDLRAITSELRRRIPGFDNSEPGYYENLLGSFLALLSAARVETPRAQGEEPGLAPLVQIRLQLWMRELSRLVAKVEIPPPGGSPHLVFADDLSKEEAVQALPVVHCRDCGVTGWAGLYKQGEQQLTGELKAFYSAYFNFLPNVRFVYPEDPGPAGASIGFPWRLCTGCLRLTQVLEPATCATCGAGVDRTLAVWVPDNRYKDDAGKLHSSHNCVSCGGHNSLTIVGSRSASLTSVAISQLFASRFNDDKKLLAFSDSVQDASHRAGFFAARTYTFNLRTAVQRVVDAQEEPIPLSELSSRFINHWRPEFGDERFVATFLPPDMAWLRDYEAMRHDGQIPEGSDLLDLVERRLRWEVWSEYTFKSRIGRTLEKSGSSGLMLRDGILESAVGALRPRLSEEIGSLRGLDEASLRGFLLGFVESLKNKGAVDQADLNAYIETGGNTFLLSRPIHMPSLGGDSRAPTFLSSRASRRFNTLIRINVQNAPTWFEDWFARCFGHLTSGVGAVSEDALRIVATVLVERGLLFERTGPQNSRIWGLAQDAFLVTRPVTQLRCERCGSNVSAATASAPNWEGIPCLRYRCRGQLRVEDPREDYYRRLYRTGDVHRVFAEEHTGLLERSVREEVEEGFINQRKAGDPNLLSCTPTLEMGIDIGDLSSLALCSMPPKPSNYLQRIGRGGRRDGNAFVLAVANGRPHDLFFFFEPEEMIQGLIEPPGCFLNASAVLERQFTGYVFDRWVETGLVADAIPKRLQAVLDTVERTNPPRDAFPNNLLAFYELGRTSLEDGFFEMFGEEISEHARARLRSWIHGGPLAEQGLAVRLLDELNGVAKERRSLRNAVRRLTERVNKAESGPAGTVEEAELEELRQEKTALNHVIAEINQKNVLNFFTDAGLLPNYAFPESGVQLKSIIYRKNEKASDSEKKYEIRTYEYERPAASAIHELAPSNVFYAQGRKLLIDQVNVDLSKAEPWRFCSECTYMELEGEHELGTVCPKCESPLWPDEGRRRTMLRMKQVMSTDNDRQSRSHDESDERTPEFFQRNMFVIKEAADATAAYSLAAEDVPFGFEFFRKLTLREVNFGKTGSGAGTLRIAGQDFEEAGFAICKACGKVKGVRKKSHVPGKIQVSEHALHCRFRAAQGEPAPEGEGAAFLANFLYREFTSEGIRILLPVAFDIGMKIESFVAALDLGLRKRFRGDPGHLLTTVYSEPVAGSDVRRQYLVLYDGVPGGTGYLNELTRDEHGLLDVLQLAQDTLLACACQQDPQKDGCYRCLLAYRGRHDRLRTSRRAALEILIPILLRRESIRKVERIDTIPLNSLLESELEARFVEALRRSRPGGKPLQLTPQVVRGRPGWFLKSECGNWLVEPQVELGPEDGVSIPSRADFVLHPDRAGDGRKPIAVFADGYEFHADPSSGNQRLGEDTAQRLAIVRSGRYLVWSLNWDDVQGAMQASSSDFVAPMPAHADLFPQVITSIDPDTAADWYALRSATSFDLLTAQLATAGTRNWSRFAEAWLLTCLEPGNGLSIDGARKVRDRFLAPELSPDETSDAEGMRGETWQHGMLAEDLLGSFPVIRAAVFAETEKIRSGQSGAVAVTIRLFEEHAAGAPGEWKRAWRRFLWLMNVTQFVPRLEFVTSYGLRDDRYSALLEDLFEPPTPPEAVIAEDVKGLVAHSDPSLHDLIVFLHGGGMPLPEPGYELQRADGEIVGVAELGWNNERVAVLLGRDEESRDAFETLGWVALRAVDVVVTPQLLTAALLRKA